MSDSIKAILAHYQDDEEGCVNALSGLIKRQQAKAIDEHLDCLIEKAEKECNEPITSTTLFTSPCSAAIWLKAQKNSFIISFY